MTASKRHRILVASDGSPSAQAALAAAARFPWGASARARAVVGRTDWMPPESADARAAIARHEALVADAARRSLSKRWPNAEATVVARLPVDAILREAQAFGATAVVLGWRGHGRFRRVLAGSVSRAVAAHAQCPVLVVRESPRAFRTFVVGYDGCANAQRALEFLCTLEPPAGSRVVLVDVVEPVSAPASAALLPPSARALLRREAKKLNEERARTAYDTLNAGVARLKRCGWSASGEVRPGAPLERLLAAADDHRADVLVVGARGVSGLERALLGSVANGALNRSARPVLVVR